MAGLRLWLTLALVLAVSPARAELALGPCPDADMPPEASCGALASPDGAAIDIVVLPAEGGADDASPLVVVAGDPGAPLAQWAAPVAANLEAVRAARDLVLVGRWTDDDCALYPAAEALFGALLPVAAVRACAGLSARPLSPVELELVREGFGLDRLDLFADGPATRLALAYAAGYPGRLRTLALRGAWPADHVPTLAFAVQAQRAFDQLFVRCARDGPCRKAFDDVKHDFTTVLARLRETPGEVTVTEPATAASVTVPFGADAFAIGLRLALDDPETYARVPAAIAAAATGDLGPAAALVIVTRDRFDALAMGAHLAARCAEDGAALAAADLAAETRLTYVGADFAAAYREACAARPVEAIVPLAPEESEVPALFLSGEVDPWAVPSLAERAMAGFADARHVVFAGPAHGTPEAEECVAALLAAFVEAGTTEDLDAGCAKATRLPAFFVPEKGEP
jgi:pimeloyl-ACP methyl ester carboxylesterase